MISRIPVVVGEVLPITALTPNTVHVRHLLIALVAACGSEPAPLVDAGTDAPQSCRAVVNYCGNPPPFPGWAVQVSGGTATTTANEYDAVAEWIETMQMFRQCVLDNL